MVVQNRLHGVNLPQILVKQFKKQCNGSKSDFFSNTTKNVRCSEKKIYLTLVPNDLIKGNPHICSYSY